MLPKGKIMFVNLLFYQCLVFCPFWSFYHHQWVWSTISFFADAFFLPPQYSLYLYISSISLPQSVGRFVKIVLKISLFYIYRRHSNRKPERSWNKQIIAVFIQLKATYSDYEFDFGSISNAAQLCETFWNFNEKENSVSLKKFHKDAMQPGSQKLHLMVMTPL